MSNVLSSLSLSDKLIITSDIGEISNYTTYWTKPDGSVSLGNAPNMPYNDGTLFSNKPIHFMEVFKDIIYFISNDGTIFKYESESFQDISVSLLTDEEITSAIIYFDNLIIGTNLSRIYINDNGWIMPEDSSVDMAIDLLSINILSEKRKIVKFLIQKQDLVVISDNGEVCYYSKNKKINDYRNSWVSFNSKKRYSKEGFNNENVKEAFSL